RRAVRAKMQFAGVAMALDKRLAAPLAVAQPFREINIASFTVHHELKGPGVRGQGSAGRIAQQKMPKAYEIASQLAPGPRHSAPISISHFALDNEAGNAHQGLTVRRMGKDVERFNGFAGVMPGGGAGAFKRAVLINQAQ